MAWRPDYLTLAEAKDFAEIDGTADDVKIGRAIAAASRAIDRHCLRQFGQVDTAEERTYPVAPYTLYRRGSHRIVVQVDDLMDLTGMVVTYRGGTVADVLTWPDNAAQTGKPWTHLLLPAAYATYAPDEVTVEALWGWSAVPEAVAEGCALQVSRLMSRPNAPFGVAGSPEAGSEVRLLAKLDPDVAVSLSDYRRRGGVG